jgi:hypothetical protein
MVATIFPLFVIAQVAQRQSLQYPADDQRARLIGGSKYRCSKKLQLSPRRGRLRGFAIAASA